MSRYCISKNDIKYAKEFKKNLYENNYYHSPGLQRILNLFRSDIKKEKFVLIVENNSQSWHLGCLPENRGQKIKKYTKINFKNLLDAEWYVFNKRWKKHTGINLKI